MSDRSRRIAVLAVVAAVTGLLVLYLALLPSVGPDAAEATGTNPADEWPLVFAAYLSLIAGAVLVLRRPRNPIGMLLMLDVGFASYSPLVVLVTWLRPMLGDANLGLRLLAWTGNWIWVVTFVGIIYTTLLIPNGEYLSRRWRRVGQIAAVVLGAQMLVTMLVPYLEAAPDLDNPLGVAALGSFEPVIGALALVMLALTAAGTLSVVLRYVRSSGVERLQLKWIAYAFATAALTVIVSSFLNAQEGLVPNHVMTLVDGLATLVPVAAIVIAVLRYRLYDIDVVINRTLVFGSLAAFITTVYVAIVVGLGTLVGAGGDDPSLALSIVATAVVAVGFQPTRRRLQRLANRLVYGHRATPYEVLAGFSRRVVDADTADGGVFVQVCRLLVEGTGATAAAVRRRAEDGSLDPLATWPEGDHGPGSSPTAGTVQRPISWEGSELGVLSVTEPAGESLTSSAADLLDHLAAGLGLLLHNTQLTDDLRGRVVELERSRARLVEAEDEVRREVERQLREGPQHALGQLVDRLRDLQERAAAAGATRTPQLLGSVTDAAQAADEAVSDFARGVFPPVLEDEGLPGALRERGDAAPLPVTVHTRTGRRFARDIEAALYFAAAEALQNVVKYADASSAHIALDEDDGRVVLQVVDDGDGFDPASTVPGSGTTNMAERVDAVGGELTIESTPGHGTTVTAEVPIPQREDGPAEVDALT